MSKGKHGGKFRNKSKARLYINSRPNIGHMGRLIIGGHRSGSSRVVLSPLLRWATDDLEYPGLEPWMDDAQG